MSSKITVVGSVNAGPSNPAGTTNLSSYVDLTVNAQYPSVGSGNVSIAGTNLVPYVLEPGVAQKNFVAIKSVDGAAFRALLSSAIGVDVPIPFDDLFVLHVPLAGDQLTSVKLIGTGRIEYFVAGA